MALQTLCSWACQPVTHAPRCALRSCGGSSAAGSTPPRHQRCSSLMHPAWSAASRQLGHRHCRSRRTAAPPPCSYGGEPSSSGAAGGITAEATGSLLIQKEVVLFLIQQVIFFLHVQACDLLPQQIQAYHNVNHTFGLLSRSGAVLACLVYPVVSIDSPFHWFCPQDYDKQLQRALNNDNFEAAAELRQRRERLVEAVDGFQVRLQMHIIGVQASVSSVLCMLQLLCKSQPSVFPCNCGVLVHSDRPVHACVSWNAHQSWCPGVRKPPCPIPGL